MLIANLYRVYLVLKISLTKTKSLPQTNWFAPPIPIKSNKPLLSPNLLTKVSSTVWSTLYESQLYCNGVMMVA